MNPRSMMLVVFALMSCTTTPITQRRSLALVPESQMNDLGTQFSGMKLPMLRRGTPKSA